MVGKPEGKGPLRRPRHRWENNIRMYLREIRWKGVDFIHLTQDRDQWRALANTEMSFRIPYKAENFLTSRVIFSVPRRILLVEVSLLQ
jgi:hypothetical protein